jgi:hypothetical protein
MSHHDLWDEEHHDAYEFSSTFVAQLSSLSNPSSFLVLLPEERSKVCQPLSFSSILAFFETVSPSLPDLPSITFYRRKIHCRFKKSLFFFLLKTWCFVVMNLMQGRQKRNNKKIKKKCNQFLIVRIPVSHVPWDSRWKQQACCSRTMLKGAYFLSFSNRLTTKTYWKNKIKNKITGIPAVVIARQRPWSLTTKKWIQYKKNFVSEPLLETSTTMRTCGVYADNRSVYHSLSIRVLDLSLLGTIVFSFESSWEENRTEKEQLERQGFRWSRQMTKYKGFENQGLRLSRREY